MDFDAPIAHKTCDYDMGDNYLDKYENLFREAVKDGKITQVTIDDSEAQEKLDIAKKLGKEFYNCWFWRPRCTFSRYDFSKFLYACR